MKTYRWSHEKNETLKRERNLSFERIVLAIEGTGLLDDIVHPNSVKYPNQSVLVVELDRYVYLVPYIGEDQFYFLKTIFPSRKATQHYLKPNT